MKSSIGIVLTEFRLNRNFIIGLVFLLVGAVVFPVLAVTGTSPEFKIDLRGLGPWERRTAADTESLSYSAAWATNAGTGAKAVVKAMPVLKQKPSM